jgi:hypothetical protein
MKPGGEAGNANIARLLPKATVVLSPLRIVQGERFFMETFT